jgi:ferredoxin
VRVVIDPEVCQGHLRCFSVAPDMFDVDEQGNGIVIWGVIDTPEDIERAESAVVGCPEGAIRIEQ